jgi:hypothetical protein
MTSEERLAQIEHRLTTLEVTLWGQHGENGLRSDIREMKRKMDMILRWVWVTSALLEGAENWNRDCLPMSYDRLPCLA